MNYHITIQLIVSKVIPGLEKLADVETELKPSSKKWSIKEILGHLVDSAYHNHQRVIYAERQGHLVFPGYDQDHWVLKNDYQNRGWRELILLWKMVNLHFACVVKKIKEDHLEKEYSSHNFHEVCMNPWPKHRRASLAYLIWDYIQHLEHHLNQVLPAYEKVGSPYDGSSPFSDRHGIHIEVPWLAFR